MTQARQICLAGRPEGGAVQPEHFSLCERELPPLEDGQVAVEVSHFALDPFVRGLMDERSSSGDAMGGFTTAMALGDVIRSEGVGQVAASRAPHLREGDRVTGHFGWTDHVVIDAKSVRPVRSDVDPTWHLAALGISGKTAYFGLMAAHPSPGQTVLISSAAGAIGSLCGQIARLKGLDPVGLAGGLEKCEWLTDSCGYSAALDYRRKSFEALSAELAELRPDGIDVFYDNVGGAILDAAIRCMAPKGRVVICGTISQYAHKGEEELAPRWNRRVLSMGLTIRGFNVLESAERTDDFEEEMHAWLVNGGIRQNIHVFEGLAAAPDALISLLSGSYRGKVLVQVA
ncbi:MAG: NADP-dependent oxidoreductase [Rhodovibrionaceae bacterium]